MMIQQLIAFKKFCPDQQRRQNIKKIAQKSNYSTMSMVGSKIVPP